MVTDPVSTLEALSDRKTQAMTKIVETRFLRKPEPSRWAHHECQTCGAFISDTAAHAHWHGELVGRVIDAVQIIDSEQVEVSPSMDAPQGFGMTVEPSLSGWPSRGDTPDETETETTVDVEVQPVGSAPVTECVTTDDAEKTAAKTSRKPSRKRAATKP